MFEIVTTKQRKLVGSDDKNKTSTVLVLPAEGLELKSSNWWLKIIAIRLMRYITNEILLSILFFYFPPAGMNLAFHLFCRQ